MRHRSAALRERLKQAALLDRDLADEIAGDFRAVDREAWQNPQPRGAQSKAFHPRRGEIYLVALDSTVGHEIKKTRPALVIQNDVSNEYSGTTIVVPITSPLSGCRSPRRISSS
jgi:hypothetical protein